MELSPKHNLPPSIKTVLWTKDNHSDGVEYYLIKYSGGRCVLRADRGAHDLNGPRVYVSTFYIISSSLAIKLLSVILAVTSLPVYSSSVSIFSFDPSSNHV